MTAYTQMKLRHSITIGRKRMYQQTTTTTPFSNENSAGGRRRRKAGRIWVRMSNMLPCVSNIISPAAVCKGPRGELCVCRVKRYICYGQLYIWWNCTDNWLCYSYTGLDGRMIYRLPIVQCLNSCASWPAGKCCTVLSSVYKRPHDSRSNNLDKYQANMYRYLDI
jgi:hypothetical protein